MGRIPWSRLSGEECETLISMLICCEHPRAWRPKPARGDGGIDILVPRPDGSADIFQIKRHDKKLTKDQKYKIKLSLTRLQTYAAKTGLRVASWTLVTPMLPTNPERDWFAELTQDAGFDAEWNDLTRIETWAARHPAMADYYVHNGQERLHASLERLAAVLHMDRKIEQAGHGGPGLVPADTVGTLQGMIKLINDLDPFYRYGIDITDTPPDGDLLRRDPKLAFAESHWVDGESCVTFRVYPRFDEALQERPITMNLTLVAEGQDAAGVLKDWLRFGTPFSAPINAINISADLPGGFETPQEALIRLSPAYSDQPPRPVRLQVLDPAGQVVAETRVLLDPSTFGLDRQGACTTGKEHHGTFEFEIRMDLAEQTTMIQFSPADVTGKAPSDLAAGARVLRNLRAPHRLRFALAHGPIDDTLAAFQLHSPNGPAVGFCDLVDDLALIQEHTTHQLVMPDLDALTNNMVDTISQAARLLRGEQVISHHRELVIPATYESAPAGDGAYTLEPEVPLVLRINGVSIPIGTVRHALSACNIERIVSDAGAAETLRLTSFEGETMTLTRTLISEVLPQVTS